jgi:hypothetical protein
MEISTAPRIKSERVCSSCQAPCGSDQLYCERCGCILPDTLSGEAFLYATERLGSLESKDVDLKWGTGYFHQHARLVFQVGNTENNISIPALNKPIVVGRRGGSAIPHVDLTPYGAEELGVSRYHVRIERKGDSIEVTDLSSNNGTYLNRERLTPNEAYLLRNRAVLQLGKMLLRIQFV